MSLEVRKPALGRIKKRSIANEAEEKLIQAIASGRLSRGARIVETDIAEDLGVSRIPVREALLHLGSLGILQPAGNRGWQVSSFDDRQIAETYQVRLALETMMLTLAQDRFRADRSKLAPLDTIIAEMRTAAEGDDVAEMNRLDLAFHRYAVSISDNSLAIRMWEGLSQHVLIIFEMEIYRIPDPNVVVAQHMLLRDVLASGDAANLATTLREHITGYRADMLKRSAGEPQSKD